jgi:glutaredoxin
MNESLRKKSPRAPSISLDESVERALKIYEKERRHPTPTDVIAQNLGYKSANNGAALSAIASLRSYGLLEKVRDGALAVSKDVEDYRFAPTSELKAQLRVQWLKAPNIFSELLEKYSSGLPSDASLRFDLIQRGFTPASAESTVTVFKKSIEFASFFDEKSSATRELEEPISESEEHESQPTLANNGQSRPTEVVTTIGGLSTQNGYDRIPVRLVGGRRAWLEIPTPFYEADKKRLVAQIELILAENSEEDPKSF